MMLDTILVNKRDEILGRWFDTIIKTYPEDAQGLFRNLADDFSNPVGSIISHGLGTIFDALVNGTSLESDEICRFLDGIVRIRAVQDFSPAEAVEFAFQLKGVTREAVVGEAQDGGILEELLTFESRIDKLALLSFNIYSQCREKIYELRAAELKNRTSRILERAVQVWDRRDHVSPEEQE